MSVGRKVPLKMELFPVGAAGCTAHCSASAWVRDPRTGQGVSLSHFGFVYLCSVCLSSTGKVKDRVVGGLDKINERIIGVNGILVPISSIRPLEEIIETPKNILDRMWEFPTGSRIKAKMISSNYGLIH